MRIHETPDREEHGVPALPARWLAAVLIVICLTLVACTDNALKVVSQAVADIATGTATAQNIAIMANQQGSLSQADTANILGICAQINAADSQVSSIIRGQANLTPDKRSTIDTLLKPLVIAVQGAIVNSGKVTDPNTRATLTAAFNLALTGLTAAEGVLQK